MFEEIAGNGKCGNPSNYKGLRDFGFCPDAGGVTRSQTRRDTNFAIPGYSISAIIPRRGRKSKIFLSVVIPVVKAAFVLRLAIGGNPANAGVTRLCGVSQCPVPDTATALPKQAPYQLGYTRIFSLFIRLVVFSQMWRPTNWATPGYSISAIIPRRGRKSKGFRRGGRKPKGVRLQREKRFSGYREKKGFPAAEEIERFPGEEKTKGFSGGGDALLMSKYTALGLNFLL